MQGKATETLTDAQRWALESTRANALERELTEVRDQMAVRAGRERDGIYQKDMLDLRNEGSLLREALRAALVKLDRPDCDTCFGKGHFIDDDRNSFECTDCYGAGRAWVL